ncbi:zinc-dependent metalloprotease [Runella sp.]|uniref:zinc-dependent metalloprotease n=1 Tax=Runella sp. TaxID=1960881 RepID=UPI003D0B4063
MRKTLLLTLLSYSLFAQNPVETFTKDMEKKDGFLPYYWDAKKGKIYLEIKQFDTELLYYPTLAQGIGSNDIGLDRGRLGQEHIIKFQRTGNKILMMEPNYGYRALSNDPLERRAVEESFAQSVLWGFEIAAENAGTALVELTPFLLQDAVGAIQDIARTKQGTFKLDASRSALYLPNTKNFPQNTEFEVTITLTGDSPGGYLRSVVPTPTTISTRQHHSFVQLPDNDYKPRAFDPRMGYIFTSFYDYASPVSEPIEKRYIVRHRLKKKDPSAALSEPVKPIVYYIDPGAPEPIRSALVEGAKWWNQAFEAAGYKDAFQVKLLPADADPMDVRYNLVQWVHRSTRGWSYGGSIIDPRTGEILKGKVTLGSLRVRQDYLIAQGLVGDYKTDSTNTDDMLGMSIDRLKQLSAHEIGHTIGLPHNYVASVHGRASVMDYPHMLVELKNGKVDLSNAYDKKIGDYDKWSIIWGYQDFPKGTDEKKALNGIVDQMYTKGLYFLTDQDARPEGSAHPQTHLWDNGSNAVAELKRVSEIRKLTLSNFDERKLRTGTPMSSLEEVFVPMYMFHRFQVEAASKVLAGVNYRFSVKGEKDLATLPVNGKEQREALAALLQTIQPDFLKVPDGVLKMTPPRAFGYNANPRETFKRRTGLVFDPLAPPEAATGLTLRMLLNPERLSRLVIQSSIDASLPSLEEVLDQLINATWKSAAPRVNYTGEIERLVENLALGHLLDISRNKDVTPQVRAIVSLKVQELKGWLATRTSTDSKQKAHYLFANRQIEEASTNAGDLIPVSPMTPPDGQPIESGYEWLAPACDWELPSFSKGK